MGYVPRSDYIYDLATYGNMYDHEGYQKIYYANTARVVEAIRTTERYDYKAFVYVSTSSVTLPHQTFYSASKQATEKFLQIYAREKKKPIVIVRPYSITGVGEQESHLIPKLIDSCMNGTEMPFVGEPTHDFVDVEDVVNATILIAINASKNKGEVFGVGRGIRISNNEVKEAVENIVGNKANVKMVKSMRDYDNKEWVADITRIYSLGWSPKITLEKSIRRMYAKKKNT